jgi:hypothetical protein
VGGRNLPPHVYCLPQAIVADFSIPDSYFFGGGLEKDHVWFNSFS